MGFKCIFLHQESGLSVTVVYYHSSTLELVHYACTVDTDVISISLCVYVWLAVSICVCIDYFFSPLLP